jgi:biotin operon repressor
VAKKPWFKWWADKWLSDEELRACSPGARGIWADMLSLMHKSDRCGYLLIGGNAPSHDQIARMTGCSSEELSHLLTELQSTGVVSATDDGVYYSRRMVRDAAKACKCAKAGKNGGGNPKIKHIKPKPKTAPPSEPVKEPYPQPHDSGGDAKNKTNDPWVNVVKAIEQRLVYPLSASELDKLNRLFNQVEESPLMKDGEPVPTDQVLIGAIGTINDNVKYWPRYLAAVIDNSRREGTIPGETSSGPSPPSSKSSVDRDAIIQRALNAKDESDDQANDRRRT